MIKNIADVDTGIIFWLELQEGKSAMLHKQFSRDLKPTSAVVRRLITPIVSSGRTIYMDSWFTNLETVEAVESTGNYMVGMVKLGGKGIPKDLLVSLQYSHGSAHKVLHSNLRSDGRVMCVGWNEPGKKEGSKKPGVKVFIATAH